ncbi:Rrf2 family transcriptional regulator [Candidatus Falkowbacteria bacterium]|nr:Rrf2 family transcriptional regulator [Candidatus Falkowbacteria bacterium]
MKFSTKTTYGLRAMICLGRNWQQGDLSLTEIAQKEKMSLSYLEQLFAKMRQAKLVVGSRGSGGGYQLSREPKAVSVFEIISALEGETELFYCLAENGKIHCSADCHCGVNLVFKKTNDALKNALTDLTLDKLLS